MQAYLDVNSILESTNTIAADAREAFTNRTVLLDDITNRSTSNQGQLEALNSSIDSLQQQLQRAMQAAASVSFKLTYLSIFLDLRNSISSFNFVLHSLVLSFYLMCN